MRQIFPLLLITILTNIGYAKEYVPLSFWSFDTQKPEATTGSNPIRSRTTGHVKYVQGVNKKALFIARRLTKYDKPERGDLKIQTNERINAQQGTISFWFKPSFDIESISGWGYGLIRTSNDTKGLTLGYSPQSGGRGGYWYAGFPDHDIPQCKIFGHDSSQNAVTWMHLSYTWKLGNVSRLYLNGKLQGHYSEMPYLKKASWTTNELILSAGLGSGGGIFLDELAIYDQPLPADEIHKQYLQHAEFSIIQNIPDDNKILKEDGKLEFKIQSSVPVTVIKQILNPQQNVEWEEPVELTKGLNNISFDFRNIQSSATGRYYVRIKSNRLNSDYSVGMNVVAHETYKKTDNESIQRKEVASVDCAQELDPEYFYENGQTRIVESSAGKYREILPASEAGYKMGEGFFSYRFDIVNPHKPHVMEIAYPDDKKRAIAFNVATGVHAPPQGVGVISGNNDLLTGKMRIRKFIFWPVTIHCALTIHHWKKSNPGAIASFKVYELNDLPVLKITEPADGKSRSVGIQVEDADISYWGGYGQGLGFWNTSLRHMTSLMRHCGLNTYQYPMMWYGGPLFKSDFNTQFGAGTNRRSSHPDGTFALISDRMNQAEIEYYPELYFREMSSLTMPAFDRKPRATKTEINNEIFGISDAQWPYRYRGDFKETDDMIQVAYNGEKRSSWRQRLTNDGASIGPVYNPLHPAVQKVLLQIVDDFLRTIDTDSKIGGFVFDLTSWGGTPSVENFNFDYLTTDYSDFTIQLFIKETGIVVPGDKDDMNRFQKRYDYLTSDQVREKWIDWRCQKIHDLIQSISKKVWEAFPDTKIILSLAPRGNQMGPREAGYPLTFLEGSRYCGIDPALYQDDSRFVIQLFDSLVSGQDVAEVRQRKSDEIYPEYWLQKNHLNPFLGTGHTSMNQWHCYWEIFKPLYRETLWKEVAAQCAPVRTITESGRGLFKTWTRYLANFDIKHLNMGGMGVSAYLGHLDETRSFVKAYRHLPSENFEELKQTNKLSMVVGRTYKGKNRSYCYLVNPEPDPVKIKVFVSGVNIIFDPVQNKNIQIESGMHYFVLPEYSIQSFSCDAQGGFIAVDAESPHSSIKRIANMYMKLHKSAMKQYPDLKNRQPGDFYYFREAEKAESFKNTVADPWKHNVLSTTNTKMQMPSSNHDIALNQNGQLQYPITAPATGTYYLWIRPTAAKSNSMGTLKVSVNGAYEKPFTIQKSGGNHWVGCHKILLNAGHNQMSIRYTGKSDVSLPLDIIAVTDNQNYMPSSLIAGHPDFKDFSNLFQQIDNSITTFDLRSARRDLGLLKSMSKKIGIAEYAVNVKPLHWQIVGPFDGMERKDLLTINPPDSDLYTPELKVPEFYLDGIKKRTVQTIEQGYEYLHQPKRGSIKLDATGTYYAFTEIYSVRNKGVAVLLGLDDWAIITHNGKEIYRFDGRSTGSFYGQYKVRLRLKKGKNVFGIKLINGGGPGGFNFDIIDGTQKWPVGVMGM